jgi:L-ascorbate metabolism protein UlaG (beta-lactamase superfamily)
LRITATLAQHGPDGTEHITGTGDTLPQAGLHKIIARYRGRIDFAFLHLGVAKLPLFRGQAVSMSASHAVDFAKELLQRRIVPIHYEDWAHFSEGRTAAAELFAAARCQDRVIWLEPRPSQVSV